MEKLVLHCQSNQGHAIWVHMLKREPSLGAKVSAIFYDCAASPEDFFTAEMGPEISIKSVMATLGGFKVVPPPNVMPLIQQGAKAHHKAMGVERSLRTLAVCPAAFEWLAAHEPPVPATCVTSPEDTVIKMDGVQTFASMLRKAQPSRKVKVEVLRGQHVQVMRTSTAQYEEALRELIASADIGGTWIE